MTDIEVRLATLGDAPAIARIRITTWQCAYKGQMPELLLTNLSIEEDIKNWERRITHPPKGKVDFVALLENQVVGFCSVGHCRDEDMHSLTGEIWAIYVDPEYMHRGVGSALMEKSLEYLRILGLKKAILWVLSTNENTIKWYEHKGWRKEGKEKVEKEGIYELNESRFIISL